MNRTINIAEALPGAGKSTKFINTLPNFIPGKHIVYAMPTNALIKELAQDIKTKAGIIPTVITSDTTDHVVANIEKAMASNQSLLLMVTHESLRRVDARLLAGWELVMDEVPSVSDCWSHQFDSISYLSSLERYLTVDENKKATLKPEHVALVESMIKAKEGAPLAAQPLRCLRL